MKNVFCDFCYLHVFEYNNYTIIKTNRARNKT